MKNQKKFQIHFEPPSSTMSETQTVSNIFAFMFSLFRLSVPEVHASREIRRYRSILTDMLSVSAPLSRIQNFPFLHLACPTVRAIAVPHFASSKHEMYVLRRPHPRRPHHHPQTEHSRNGSEKRIPPEFDHERNSRHVFSSRSDP